MILRIKVSDVEVIHSSFGPYRSGYMVDKRHKLPDETVRMTRISVVTVVVDLISIFAGRNLQSH